MCSIPSYKNVLEWVKKSKKNEDIQQAVTVAFKFGVPGKPKRREKCQNVAEKIEKLS